MSAVSQRPGPGDCKNLYQNCPVRDYASGPESGSLCQEKSSAETGSEKFIVIPTLSELSENIVLLFENEEGVECRAELKATGVEYTFDYEDDYDSDYDFTVEVPSVISFSLKEGDVEHISYTTTLDIEASTSVKQTTSVRFTNIIYSTEVEATKNNVSANVLLKYGDRTIFECSASAPNCKLKDKTDAQEWEDWFEMYGEALWNEDAAVKYGNLVGYANILEQVQVKVAVSDLKPAFIVRDYDKNNCLYPDKPYPFPKQSSP